MSFEAEFSGARARALLLRAVLSVVAALPLCASAPTTERERDAVALDVVGIDSRIWHPAAGIRWPKGGVGVDVYYSSSALFDALGLSEIDRARFDQKDDSIRLGEANGRLNVLVSDATLSSDRLRDFVASHEAFHLAAQYYGMRIPVGIISAVGQEDEVAVDGFWREFGDQSSRALREQNEVDCTKLLALYSSLSPADKKYVLSKAFWEWPAEYYSRRLAFGDDEQGYLRLRAAIPGGGQLYVAGSAALFLVDKKHGRDRGWQYQISSGTNPVDIFLGSAGCKVIGVQEASFPVSKVSMLEGID